MGAYFHLCSAGVLVFFFSSSSVLPQVGECEGTNRVTVCSEAGLRTAIQAGGLVTFCCDGTIALTNTIEIARDVALDARGHSVIIDGGRQVRLFWVNSGVHFAVTNLTMANGFNRGLNGSNGVYNQAGVIQFPEPGHPGRGGAIFNAGGRVTLSGCHLQSNHVVGGDGGTSVAVGAVGGDALGGAIFSQNGSLKVVGATLSSNVASAGGGGPAQNWFVRGGDARGGAVFCTNTEMVVWNCSLSSNACVSVAGAPPALDDGRVSLASGGAIMQWSGSLQVSNSVLLANTAVGGDTPNFLTAQFMIPGSAEGGAIAVRSGAANVDRVRFDSNSTSGGDGYQNSETGEARGGALITDGPTRVNDCTFVGNQAFAGSGSRVNADGRGGAIYSSGPTLMNGCSVYLNIARGGDAGGFGSPQPTFPGGHGFGGGIFNSGDLVAVNCTIALNTAFGGLSLFGFPGGAKGGGIYNSTNGLLSVTNLTVANNLVDWNKTLRQPVPGTLGGANLGNDGDRPAACRLRNSLLATDGTNGNVIGTVVDDGFNISSDGSPSFSSGSSRNFTDPRLRPLASYGGLTWTMALEPDSPAVDSISATGFPLTDQRGMRRPFGAAADAGAFEYYPLMQPRLEISLSPAEGFVVSFTTVPGLSCRLQTADNLNRNSGTVWEDLELFELFESATVVTRKYVPGVGVGVGVGASRFFRLKCP